MRNLSSGTFSKKRWGFIPFRSKTSRCLPLSRRRRYSGLLTGFTLLETLIYIALLSLMLAFTIIIFYGISDSQTKNGLKLETANESNFLFQKISWAFSGAQAVNQLTAASSSATLSLSKYNFSENPLVFVFSSSTVTLARGGGQPANLLSGNVNPNSLLVVHGAVGGGSLRVDTVLFQGAFSSSAVVYDCAANQGQPIVSSFVLPLTVNCELPEFVYVSVALISSATPGTAGPPASTTLANTFYLEK